MADTPIVQSNETNFNPFSDFKPLVLKDKTLFDAGYWNNFFYSANSVKNIFEHTNWKDDSTRFLFLDHDDGNPVQDGSTVNKVANWVGFVKNERFENGKVIGDLWIYDPVLATKLYYAKPKIGVSSRVKAQVPEGSSNVVDGYFENHNLVINPAVKTAYINNSQVPYSEKELAQVTDMEAKRKELGMSVDEFYAIPRDPPSESKLPIFDETHVRNALARVNQVEGVSAEEKAKALSKIHSKAKKYGIEVTKENQEGGSMDMESMMKEMMSMMKSIMDKMGMKEEEMKKKEDMPKMSTMEHSDKGDKMSEVKTEPAKEPTPVIEPTKAPEPAPFVVQNIAPNDSHVRELEAKLAKMETMQSEMEKRLSEPKRLTQETGNNAVPESSGDVDVDMLNYLKGISGYK